MHFLIFRKADDDSEAGAAPSRALVEAMADHCDLLAARGRFHAGEGLKPSRDGVRVRFNDDRKAILVDGPFAETRELVAGFSIVEADSLDDALAWVKEWPAEDAHGAAEVEVWPIGCPAGLSGFGDPAEDDDGNRRWIVMLKANDRSEADGSPGPVALERMAAANQAGRNAGVLMAGHGLPASRHAKRVRFSEGKPMVQDGPFAEIKELIAGFWVLRADTLDDVMAWVTSYPFPDGDASRLEIRPLYAMRELLATHG